MRRWNGWGDDHTHYPIPATAASYLADKIGPGQRIPDASLEQVLANMPATRLPEHPLVHSDSLERLHHARGQSLPDWIALRYGTVDTYPDGVAYPQDSFQVRELFNYAQRTGASLIPYGGGTSVVGHINPPPGDRPVLTVDLYRLNQLAALDKTSRLATFGAGVRGPELEAGLNSLGYTLGHFPQSFEFSTLGGWIATRSSGQQSYYYGRIENLFAGGQIETPVGTLELPILPASAAGPDLRQVILGSEGRMGVITHATVRIQPLPESEVFYGVFFREWDAAVEAVRQIAQERVPISMARLSNAQETDTTLTLSGKDDLVSWAKRGLNLLGYAAERCLLVFAVTGPARAARTARRRALDITRARGGLYTGSAIGNTWRKSRFLTPYLRNTLWEQGYIVDTLETALPWSQIAPTAKAIQQALLHRLEDRNERTLAFAHLSHIYPDGASIYVTYLFRRTPDPHETLERWLALKTAASQVVVAQKGTISHQHGVGLDHAPYLEAEKGALGIQMIRQVAQTLDPAGIMNPGKLFG
jgi:alkyldihydroxyacetonephosphate synthase